MRNAFYATKMATKTLSRIQQMRRLVQDQLTADGEDKGLAIEDIDSSTDSISSPEQAAEKRDKKIELNLYDSAEENADKLFQTNKKGLGTSDELSEVCSKGEYEFKG